MGADRRNAIRRALNEDAEKLIQEGDPNEPQLRRLKREIDEVDTGLLLFWWILLLNYQLFWYSGLNV